MIELVPLQREQIAELAAFIASQQASPASYVGFAGSQPAEIAHELSEFPDVAAEETFVLARQEGAIVGAIGFDVDVEKHYVYLWGPLIAAENWDALSEDLWQAVAPRLPAEIRRFDIFCHKQNERVQAWARRREIPFHSEHFIMSFERAQLDQLPAVQLGRLAPELHEQFIALHQASFPNTYFSGPDIIGKISDHQQVFVVAEGGALLGYAYVEAKPEFGEGHLEFIAVSEAARGRGVGQSLLTGLLRWLFEFPSINSIELVVSGDNPAAQSLYRRVGFRELYHMVSFRRQQID
ncbi:MAG TPA: N-acetyltransferase [Herpetosiphonaceae bacterium]|nr:N-acetyltransferase [Herpetosiphonaceae bacterium]